MIGPQHAFVLYIPFQFLQGLLIRGSVVKPKCHSSGAHFNDLGVLGYNPWNVESPTLCIFSDSASAKHSYENLHGRSHGLGVEKVPLA